MTSEKKYAPLPPPLDLTTLCNIHNIQGCCDQQCIPISAAYGKVPSPPQSPCSPKSLKQFDIQENNEDENKERGNWGSKFDFILSSVGFAVGLGNVWRFPYLCYKNGGGAFLIPYIIMLALAGLPMFAMELGFGQFTSKGCIGIWTMAPLFKGIGIAMCIITGIVCVYYNMVIAYTLFYFFASFNKVMPWSGCDNYWNTANCTINTANDSISENGTVGFNETTTRPSEEFWNNYVLGRSEGMHDMGPIRWQLCLCLLLAWIVVFLCIFKGVKSSGKVVYFTATFPYIVLFILFIRGVTLPGAADGVLFYIKPDFSKLYDATVWKDAAVQIFYSLGAAWGGLHTLASYNKFHNNFQRDAIMIALINCGTSVFAGFVIFSVIGFMAHDSGLPISEVADSGPGLAFVAYPEALARMPVSALWSLLFFFMLFTLGLDSQFVMLETLITAVVDELKEYIPNIYVFKTRITIGACVLGFLLGLPMTTNGGIYLLTLMDNYSAGFSLLLVAMLECIVVSWVYCNQERWWFGCGSRSGTFFMSTGASQFVQDMKVILKFDMNWYWRACWMVISPAILLFIFIFFCVTYGPLTYQEYTYPPAMEFLGWCMVLAAVLVIPGYMVYFLLAKAKGDGIMERLAFSVTPAEDWGPALNKHRLEAGYPLLPDIESGATGTSSPLQNGSFVNPPDYNDVISKGGNGAVILETST
ncbi:sodium- and chloride-dependent glycine transporter 1-like [Amphiura filiformis]|uniref:sodium- and chloride-dependent glycine transporter 1-like n=1 Tax=Amphiura filiformis TaxID=82378 RepID=UPI003B210552